MKRGKQDGGVTGEEAWYGVGLCSMLYWSLFRSCTLSISLSYLPLLSVSHFSYLSLSVCSSLSQCCAGVRKLQQTTKNFLECFCVYVRVCACVRGWLPTGWLLWWHDCSNARIVVDDVLENCFTVLRVKSTFVSFLLIFDLARFPEPVLTVNYIENIVCTTFYIVYAPIMRKLCYYWI